MRAVARHSPDARRSGRHDDVGRATMLHGRMLRYLDEVARCGSIRKAAERLNVAASAVNRQILSLEAELDTPLFERMPGGLRLTASGEILVAHVRDTLREHGRAVARMVALKGLQRGEVTIATMGGLAATRLADAMVEFRATHPRVKLTVRVLAQDDIMAALLAGEADLGLAFGLPSHPRLFRAMAVEHPIGAVMSPDHPLAGRLSVRFADCLSHPLLLMEGGMALRDAVDRMVPPNVDLMPALETNSLDLLRRMARTSPCITFMCGFEVDEEVRLGRLAFVPIQGGTVRQTVSLVHRASGPLDPVVSVVASFIGAAFAGSGEEG
ncbi:LysR family transcriptional regulator [Lichenibacterium ramalinae]|uniref:LysR family transcriptional regulator n=2 Tax=Lichenibacterium ramalinae TaxID=2316527 RepID=A0A4Q2RAH6_9HYPH|nr:LysR family transcriptional regulator [Lichenibacterium ramalinae]